MTTQTNGQQNKEYENSFDEKMGVWKGEWEIEIYSVSVD